LKLICLQKGKKVELKITKEQSEKLQKQTVFTLSDLVKLLKSNN